MKHLIVATSALVLGLPPTTANAANYKKIDKNGVGNCIFSSSPMPKDKEATYKVESSFKPGDDIYVRCYFGKSIQDFSKDGRMKNSLRGPIEATIAAQAEGAAYYSTITWQDDASKWWHRNRYAYVASETGAGEQQRFDLPAKESPDCDYRMVKFNSNACVSVETETRNLGKNLGKTGTYTTEVCIDVFYDKVDKTKRVNATDVDVVEWAPMAKGCFKYTVDI